MRFVILHYHIFKNAGSTIEDILDHSFGDGFATLETGNGDGIISSAELVRFLDEHPALRAFSSHQIRHPRPQAPGYVFFDICFLRDPLDRLRSYYDYFRQRPNPADPMSDLANRCTLGEFAAGMVRDFSLFVRNTQVNLIACGGDSDEPLEADLDLAIRRMRSTAFLGVVDCFAQGAAAGAVALQVAFPELDCARPPVNVSRGMQGTVASRTEELRQACGSEVFTELLRMTELDRRLVAWAREEVLRRHARVAAAASGQCGAGSVPGVAATLAGLWHLARHWRQLRGASRQTLRDALFLSQHAVVFDSAFYLARNPDVASAGLDPLIHYVRHGVKEDRKPHRLFDPGYYRQSCRTIHVPIPDGENPLVHFLRRRVPANPHPLFNCAAWLAANPDAAADGLNPLVHYLGRKRCDSPVTANPEPVRSVELDIGDVQFALRCLATPPIREPELAAGVAAVWQDATGATQWIAQPQQLPFLRSVSFDQILAQGPAE